MGYMAENQEEGVDEEENQNNEEGHEKHEKIEHIESEKIKIDHIEPNHHTKSDIIIHKSDDKKPDEKKYITKDKKQFSKFPIN